MKEEDGPWDSRYMHIQIITGPNPELRFHSKPVQMPVWWD